ncbi:MAG: ATP-binding protein [Planctomycetota bacterium]|nr:ATP-binding protein [Planctomycetota bacterium]
MDQRLTMDNGAGRFGLATKITLPFLALFALLLCVLGLVLARQILGEVEVRVENEQRFVLEVATFPGFALGEDSLRQISDRAGRAAQAGIPGGKAEFVVLQDGVPPLSTFSRDDRAAWATVEALVAAAKAGRWSQADETIRQDVGSLNRQQWLILYTARTPRGPGSALRRFFLLYPYAEIEHAQNRALLRIVGLGALGLVLAAGLGLLIAHWISGPVRRLAAAAKRISSGGLNEPLEPHLPRQGSRARGHDEIGDLTQAFQTMVETLRASQSELLKAERLAATGKLAASVAHEIRNPLTSLRMTVQMLQQRATSADAQTLEAYAVVLGEIDRLTLTVEELLTFARPRPPRRAPTDVNKLAADTLKFLERQLQHAHVHGRLELDAALPADLPLDANKIRQLLVNLVLNAQQAMVRDGTVTLRTRWQPEKRQVAVSVSDTGPGVAEEIRGKLFDLFVSTKESGGLGLAIAKQIAEEHGGTIGCDSSPQGATFTVVLPV